MRPEIVLVVDDSILSGHVGVRRYILSLYLEFGVDRAQLVKVEYDKYCRPVFSEIVVETEDAKSNLENGSHLAVCSRDEILNNIDSILAGIDGAPDSRIVPDQIFQGGALSESIRTVIWAAPWVFKHELSHRNEKTKHYVIALDAIPNLYSIERPHDIGLTLFGSQHLFAYEWFSKQGEGILCISEESHKQIKDVLNGEDEDKIFTLPLIIPAGFSDVYTGNNDTDNLAPGLKTILLASPFDRRKGMDRMLQILNKTKYDNLIIFGRIRCSVDDLIQFFKGLKNPNVKWWSRVDYRKQLELYRQAGLVLFPSYAEGLGLPVVEAQCAGTPVLVSDINPINELVPASNVMKHDVDADVAVAEKLLSLTQAEKQKYIKRFSPELSFLKTLRLAV